MRRVFLCICLVAAAFCPGKQALGVDFWVWHRAKPLSGEEQKALEPLGVKTLFWHIGEMQNRDGTWRWKGARRPLPEAGGGYRIVPVVRLTSEWRQPFSPASLKMLREELGKCTKEDGSLQLDFDCPDRLLPDYAAALRELRQSIPHLSITALTNWPRVRGFADLTRTVEEIAPMFYDLQAEPTGISVEAPPPALLDPVQLEEKLRLWKECPIPWRAGLPTFARLTVFDRTGTSRGQIPNWNWDDISFHRSLRTLAPTHLGVTILRADADSRVAATPVQKDELVVSRLTDRAALARGMEMAKHFGAAGVILFRLPDGSGPGGPSLADLVESPDSASPTLELRRTSEECLELANISRVDLGPRLSGEESDRDRGYALEIDVPAPVFREAQAGDFWRVASHAQPDTKKPQPVVVPLATRLTFWFSNLRSGGALRTGLLQLAPGASLDALRYRILDGEKPGEWKPLAPALPTSATP